MRGWRPSETGRNFLEGSDETPYTPSGVEAKCCWCHQAGLCCREVPFTRRAARVCGRHVRRDEDD
jgi:hypothetical protein